MEACIYSIFCLKWCPKLDKFLSWGFLLLREERIIPGKSEASSTSLNKVATISKLKKLNYPFAVQRTYNVVKSSSYNPMVLGLIIDRVIQMVFNLQKASRSNI